MRLIYRYIVILCLFFIVPDTLRADGEDVLERMISLPKMKGTVYSLLGNISQQSGYLFIYDSKVVDNDVTVKVRKGERTIRQAIYEITGDTSLEFKVIGTHILITSSSPIKQQQAKPSSVHPVNLMLTGTLLDKETGMPIASASVGVRGIPLSVNDPKTPSWAGTVLRHRWSRPTPVSHSRMRWPRHRKGLSPSDRTW